MGGIRKKRYRSGLVKFPIPLSKDFKWNSPYHAYDAIKTCLRRQYGVLLHLPWPFGVA